MSLETRCHVRRAGEQRGDAYCRTGRGFGTPNFRRIWSYLIGHLTQKYHFSNAPRDWCGAVLQHSGLCGRGVELQGQTLALYSITRFCNHIVYNSRQIIQSKLGPPDAAGVQTGRKDVCCNSPSPHKQLSEFCIARGHQHQEEAPPRSPRPVPPEQLRSPGHIAHQPRRWKNSQACQVGLFYFWIILYIVQYIKIQSTQKKFTVSKGSDYSLGHLYTKVPSSSIA